MALRRNLIFTLQKITVGIFGTILYISITFSKYMRQRYITKVKELLFLLPFYIIRYEKSVKKIEEDDAAFQTLIAEYGEIGNYEIEEISKISGLSMELVLDVKKEKNL